MSIYDDIAGAAAVTIPEGAIKKITRKADSVVIWEKAPAFVWKKYNAVATYEYVLKTGESGQGEFVFSFNKNLTIYSALSISQTDGSITLSSSNKIFAHEYYKYYESYPYLSFTDAGIVKVTNAWKNEDSYTGYTYNKLYTQQEMTGYSQGAYIEDVTSDNETAYPDNGRHTDGYWYVKQ